jgi:hypothetical protein
LTGAFGASLLNSAETRSYPFSFTINSANTWEQKSITIAGDTSGTWLTTTSTGISLQFNIGCGSSLLGTANTWQAGSKFGPTGSVSLVGTSGATLYITGVQLEVGSSATGFDFRPYGTELALCQRYYEFGTAVGMAYGNGTNGVNFSINMKATKRATPTGTVTVDTGSSVNYGTLSFSAIDANSTLISQTGASPVGFVRIYSAYTISSEL